MVLSLIAWSLLSNAMPAQADMRNAAQFPQGGNDNVQFQVGTATVTPTPVPMEFTEQELAEGRPIGIIIGAAALVLLILSGHSIHFGAEI